VALFATLGYEDCDGEEFEDGFEKIVIFADANGTPTHVARQVASGSWTSKLGPLEDIRHSLRGLLGGPYGHIVRFMRRRRQDAR